MVHHFCNVALAISLLRILIAFSGINEIHIVQAKSRRFRSPVAIALKHPKHGLRP